MGLHSLPHRVLFFLHQLEVQTGGKVRFVFPAKHQRLSFSVHSNHSATFHSPQQIVLSPVQSQTQFVIARLFVLVESYYAHCCAEH